ncbi:NAD(P)-dependent oxidoreductase [Polymorphospora sp. NPDC050346]|uniref:NAD-dependent epimerase/dehydratase family protein n=1 Tax=Polymorphospora sp. NPDC050346 TaxID=3155780 RepID=UPI00340F1D01
MRILLIGGAGAVGTALTAAWRDRHELTVADLRPPRTTGIRPVTLDATDAEALRAAVPGHDAVVHLAAVVPRGAAATDPRVVDLALRVNVGSVVQSLYAAHAAGVPRFVHVSSLSVFRDYGRRRITRDDRPDSTQPYGLGKRLAETACAAVADERLTVTSLRLGHPTTAALWPLWKSPAATPTDPAVRLALDGGPAFAALHPDDLAEATERTLHRGGPPYAAIAVTGDAGGTTIDDDSARSLLDWWPLPRDQEGADRS